MRNRKQIYRRNSQMAIRLDATPIGPPTTISISAATRKCILLQSNELCWWHFVLTQRATLAGSFGDYRMVG
ncbi:hypothetical protein QQG55_36765 [Brugia pahangi]